MAEISDEVEVLWPPSWQGLQQQIVYLAQFGNSVQVIHGEAGAGKTTFFNRLLQRDFGRSAVGVEAQGHGSIESFFRSILIQFGLRPDPHAALGELIAALRAFVQTLHKERSRTVLMIDEAHELSDAELGALISLLQGHTDPGVGLHVVMFAEPGFATRLDALGVLDVEVHDAHLPALSPSEVNTLLRQYKTQLGFSLDPDQAERLWNQSRGLPGKVLALAYQLRPEPVTEKIPSLRGLPIGHMAALVLLSGVLIWAFLVRSPNESPQTETKPLSIPTPTPLESSTAPTRIEPPNSLAIDGTVALPPESDTALLTPATAPPALPPSEEMAPPPANPVEEKLEIPASTASPGANLDLQKPNDKPVSKDTPKNETLSVDHNSSSAPKTVTDPLAASEQELLRLSTAGFVLQIMATSTAEAVRSYVARQPNRKNLRMYRGMRNGKTLYIVVEGFYADKGAAQAAIVNLPEQQRSAGPWAKPLEHIQREIRANRSR